MEVYNEQMRQILREQSEAEALQGSASGASGSGLTSSAISDGGSSGSSAVSNSSGGGSSSTAADDERREAKLVELHHGHGAPLALLGGLCGGAELRADILARGGAPH